MAEEKKTAEDLIEEKYMDEVKAAAEIIRELLADGELLASRIARRAQMPAALVADALEKMRVGGSVREVEKGQFTAYFLKDQVPTEDWFIADGRAFTRKKVSAYE